jgi:hypothetical protein
MKRGVRLSGRVVIFLLTWTSTLTVAFYPHQTLATEARNVRLIGHSDLQGRDSLQIVLKGNFAYIGHHRGEALNPLTGKTEPNGTSIGWANPRQPKVVAHIPGRKGAESRAVQAAHKYFDGKDYLLRNQESGEFTGFEVWDITDKANPKMVSTIGPLQAAHKSWWDAKTGYAYLSGTQPGWRGQHLIIYDLKILPAQIRSTGACPGSARGIQGEVESACIIR